MITYNHANFIQEAIESIIKQEVSFGFELVISNDCSIDETHQQILRSTENLPKHIKLKYFNQKVNLGMFDNFAFALNNCQGKYISFCEGDDYWIDNQKLSKQVDFLENNNNYNLITGGIKEYQQDSGEIKEISKRESYTFNYRDMVVRNHCHTCTTTIRNFIKEESNFMFFEDRGSDSQVWMRALGMEKKGLYTNEVLALYRRHTGGVSILNEQKNSGYNQQIKACKRKINKAEFWNNYFNNTASLSVLMVKKKMYKRMLKITFKHKKFTTGLQYLIKYFSIYLKLIVN
jgi:glycosyltransferase involved in cell wall biosynthesis